MTWFPYKDATFFSFFPFLFLYFFNLFENNFLFLLIAIHIVGFFLGSWVSIFREYLLFF